MASTGKNVQLLEPLAASAAPGPDAGWTRFVENVAPQGAQGTVRIAALLRIVSAHNAEGMKLNEIAALAGLEQSTAHRIVTALFSVGFLSRDPKSRRYHLGPLLFELFTTAFPHFNICDICLPAMEKLAKQLGDTVYLTVRSGFDGVCIERCEGSYPIRTCTVEVGQRRPLGLGAGSLVLLASLREMEINTVIEENSARFMAFGVGAPEIHRRCAQAATLGHVYQAAVTSSDVMAVAMPIKGRTGHPFGALSMTAVSSRMTPERAQIDGIEQQIRQLGYV